MKTLLLASLLFAAAAAPAQTTLTYPDLVGRLTDLEHLAILPPPGETTAQWSSYDRKSRYDAATGKYLGWDANGDNDGHIRKEGALFVLAEMTGPGCIWRIWSAAPKQGRVRIYLDGASEPAVDLPFAHYFDGQHAPFNRPALVYTVARGWNNFTPIPYAKSCKIVADADWGAYYQFVYTTFAPGTQVPTFKRELTAADNAALDAANRLLATVGPKAPRAYPNATLAADVFEVPAGSEISERLEGPAAIVGVRLRPLDLPKSPADRAVLRENFIEVRWDGESEPSVAVPLGDFFGTAPGVNAYRSLPAGMTDDGWLYSHWFMPFARTADITVRNDGATDRRFEFELVLAELPKPADQYGRFHCKWHRDAFLPADPERRAIDWTMLTTQGRGRYVGVMLHIWNPRGQWWGEGDEKFYVDGEKFPSTIGTGSEDYFGYAWCDPRLFQHAFNNQTHNTGHNRGHISVNRWHIADQIPFQKSFDAAIEKYFPNSRPTLYAATACWYLDRSGHDPYPAAPLAERVGYWDDAQLAPRTVKGALEGESLKVLRRTAGNPHPQDLAGFGESWSGDTQLWWIDARPGAVLELEVPVATAGRYRILAQFTKAPDYGIAQLALDGAKLGEPRDFYAPTVVPTGEVELGVQTLAAGPHALKVELTGKHGQALPRYMFGLDYLRLVPVTGQ
jgi:hypothetical protein